MTSAREISNTEHNASEAKLHRDGKTIDAKNFRDKIARAFGRKESKSLKRNKTSEFSTETSKTSNSSDSDISLEIMMTIISGISYLSGNEGGTMRDLRKFVFSYLNIKKIITFDDDGEHSYYEYRDNGFSRNIGNNDNFGMPEIFQTKFEAYKWCLIDGIQIVRENILDVYPFLVNIPSEKVVRVISRHANLRHVPSSDTLLPSEYIKLDERIKKWDCDEPYINYDLHKWGMYCGEVNLTNNLMLASALLPIPSPQKR